MYFKAEELSIVVGDKTEWLIPLAICSLDFAPLVMEQIRVFWRNCTKAILHFAPVMRLLFCISLKEHTLSNGNKHTFAFLAVYFIHFHWLLTL